MARIRTIKPEFWRDESLANISTEACLLAIGLLNHCDDEGYFNANPKLVESDVFPLRKLSKNTTELLRELSGIGYIQVFSSPDGRSYGHICSFEKHQVINKKTPSKIKDLCSLPHNYCIDTVVLPSGKERKGKEMEMESKAPKVATPEGVSQSVWDEFIAHRKTKKAKVSQLVIDGIVKEAKKAGWSLEDAIKETIVRNWQSFKAEWVNQPVVGKFDVSRITTPARPDRDPALVKADQDLANARPIPLEVLAKMAALRKAVV
jgi:hypothetical protein